MVYTKRELEIAFLLLLDEHLPNIECKKIEKQGNYECGRCDICMMNQYIKRAKSGEIPKLIKHEQSIK